MAAGETYQAYYVDVPALVVKRYFVRGAISKTDAKQKVIEGEYGASDVETLIYPQASINLWEATPSYQTPTPPEKRYHIL